MQIFVRTLTGKTVTLQVEDSTLVMDIKATIEEKEGIPIHRQTLVNGNKILDQDKNSLSSYNVSNEATLQMRLRWNRSDIDVDNNQNRKPKDNAEKEEVFGHKDQKDACDKFQDRLVKSMTFEMNREVEKKTVAFKKLEEERTEIGLKVSELEDKKDRNEIEFNKRERKTLKCCSYLQVEELGALKVKRATDQKILELQKESEKLELIIRDKEATRETILQKHKIDKNQTENQNRKLEQDISTLKRKRGDIEREENDLFKKKKRRRRIWCARCALKLPKSPSSSAAWITSSVINVFPGSTSAPSVGNLTVKLQFATDLPRSRSKRSKSCPRKGRPFWMESRLIQDNCGPMFTVKLNSVKFKNMRKKLKKL